MKKSYVLLVFLILSFSLHAQTENIFQRKDVRSVTSSQVLTSLATVPSVQLLVLDETKGEQLFGLQGGFTMQIPLSKGTLELELEPATILSPDFKVTTSSGSIAAVDLPHFYHGKIKGVPTSSVAIAISKDAIEGLITDQKLNLTIGRLKNSAEKLHVVYNTADISNTNPVCSGAVEEQIKESVNQNGLPQTNLTSDCKAIEVYFEADYKTYTDWGSSVQTVVNNITGIFNNVSLLFSNAGVNVVMSEFKVWDTPTPYLSSNLRRNSSSFLSAFNQYLGNNFSGDLAHLVSTENIGGGVAYIGNSQPVFNGMTSRAVFASCEKTLAKAVSGNLENSVVDIPTYSWNVYLIAHELGHNFGLPHTHNCSWSDGTNTGALDNCSRVEFSPGPCATGPTPTNGGTIMSYCHQTTIGINLANGFGPLPTAKILAEVNAATCLSGSRISRPTVAKQVTVCPGEATSLTASGCSGVYNWYDVPTGGTSLSTNSTYTTPNISANSTYFVSCTFDGCTSSRNKVDVLIINGGAVNSDRSFCTTTNSGILTLTGHAGTILRWESSTDDFTNITTITNTNATLTYSNVTTMTKYRAVVQNNGVCTRYSSAAVIDISPASPSIAISSNTAAFSICDGQSLTLSTNAVANKGVMFSKANNQYISVPHSPSISLSSTFTMEAWVNYSGSKSTIIDKGWNDYLWALNANGNANKMGFYSSRNGFWIYSTDAVPENTWTHVAITVSEGAFTFYINGVASGTASNIGPLNTIAEMNIGRQGPSTCQCNHFNGTLDELRLWNVARTQAEIQSNMGVAVPANSPGLVAYYKFDEGSGTTTADATGNGNNGTLVNNPVWQNLGTFQWLPGGETTPTLSVNTTGTYSFQIINAYGCATTSPNVEITKVQPERKITAEGPTSFCPGQSVTLSANLNTNNALSLSKAGSQYISVPHSSSINLGAVFTMEAWVNYSGSNSTIIDKGNYSFLWSLNANGNANKMGFYQRDAGNWVYSSAPVPENTWTHVAITLSGGTLTFYINGVASGAASGITIPQDTGGMNIGRQSPSTCQCNHFNGVMDELRLWNVARTTSQIRNSMNSYVGNNSAGLVAYYKFDEGSGATTADATGNGNNGTFVNTPFWQTPSTSPLSFAASVVWTPGGATTDKIIPINSGTYTASITDNYGCVSTDSTIVTVFSNAALITLASPTDDYSTGIITKTASRTNGKIIATNKITGTTKANYRAKSVELNAGFNVESGSVFLSEVGGCEDSFANGMVAYYPFNGNANDESGNGNNGVVNGPILTTDRFGNAGKAYGFDGVDDMITITQNTNLNAITKTTLSFWTNLNQVTRTTDGFDWQAFISKDTFGEWLTTMLCTDPDGCQGEQPIIFYHPGQTNSDSRYNWSGVSPNVWYHVTVSNDGAVSKFYINGALVHTANSAGSVTTNTSDIILGRCLTPVSPYPLDGKLDDLRIYNRVLTDAEVQAIYNAEKP